MKKKMREREREISSSKPKKITRGEQKNRKTD